MSDCLCMSSQPVPMHLFAGLALRYASNAFLRSLEVLGRACGGNAVHVRPLSFCSSMMIASGAIRSECSH